MEKRKNLNDDFPKRKIVVPIEFEIAGPYTIAMASDIGNLTGENGEKLGKVCLTLNGGIMIQLDRPHPDEPKITTVQVGSAMGTWAVAVADAVIAELDRLRPEIFKPYRDLEELLEEK